MLNAIGPHVKRLREARKLSQDELAARAGISASYVYYLERGDRQGTIETHAAIARALGVTLGDLLAPASQPKRRAAASR